MPQINQIVPRFSFSYVETVINDNSLVDETLNEVFTSPYVSYIFAFRSGQGIDNKFIRKRTKKSFVNTFGDSNYRKFGQPLMMPLAALDSPNAEVWSMRVMPENATYANNLITIGYKADTEDEYPDNPSKRKFRIKFVQLSADELTSESAYKKAFEGLSTRDTEGFTTAPFIGFRSSGRGKYGNDYTVKISQNVNYERETGIKMYNFDILSTTAGLEKIANYVGCCVPTDKYQIATHIDDVLADAEPGTAPVMININDSFVEDVHEAYVAFCKEQHLLLQDEYDSKLELYGIPEGMIEGTVEVTEEYADQVAELLSIQSLIDATEEKEIPDLDEFDPFYGMRVESSDVLPFFKVVESSDYADETAEDYDPNDYTSLSSDQVPEFGSVKGIEFASGTDGDFDSDDPDVVEAAIIEAYSNAFNGTYDRRVLSARRMPADALFDAAYPFAVKCVLADLATLRNDGILYLDNGVDDEEFTSANVTSIIKKFSVFDTKLVSVNVQHYMVRETTTGRRVPVSITYFLMQQFIRHALDEGTYFPFVKGRCQLSGHITDTLTPSVEDYESELKDRLYSNRINFFETLSENLYQRAAQNTTQKTDTDLVEESNVHTLYAIKRIIEQDIQENLYNFTDPTVRSTFSAYEQAKFAGWIGNRVQSIEIYFDANRWEQEHSIIHCYTAVVFRGIQKRGILEIDINRRNYDQGLDSAANIRGGTYTANEF